MPLSRTLPSQPLAFLIVRRPERVVRHVGQRGLRGGRHGREGINCLRAVRISENIEAGIVEVCTFLEVVRPISDRDRSAGRLVRFDRVLVHGRVDQAKVVDDSAGLRAFPGPEKSRHGNRRQKSDDRDYDHDFDERESLYRFCEREIFHAPTFSNVGASSAAGSPRLFVGQRPTRWRQRADLPSASRRGAARSQ